MLTQMTARPCNDWRDKDQYVEVGSKFSLKEMKVGSEIGEYLIHDCIRLQYKFDRLLHN